MTVEQLIEALQKLSPTAEVRVAYDSGCAYSDAKSVEDCGDHIYISTEPEEDNFKDFA